MKHLVLLLILAASLAFSQTAGDLNDGLIITHDAQQGAINLSWWGQSGRKYFVQQSTDLVRWRYLPVIELGQDTVITWGVSCNQDRCFFKITHTELGEGDYMALDSDGDGLSDWQETQDGTNPFDQDTDGDGSYDDEEKNSNTDPGNPESKPEILDPEEYVEVQARSITADYQDAGGTIEHTYWMYYSPYEEPSYLGSWQPYSGWSEPVTPLKRGGAFYSDFREPPVFDNLNDSRATLGQIASVENGWYSTYGPLAVTSTYTTTSQTSGGGSPPDGAYSNGATWETSYQTDSALNWSGGAMEVRLKWKPNAPRAERLSPVSKTFVKEIRENNEVQLTWAQTITINPGEPSSASGGDQNNGIIGLNADTVSPGKTLTESLTPFEIKWEAKGDWNNVQENKSPVAYQWTSNQEADPNDLWMPGKGKRIFPDKPTQEDSVRDRVVLRIKGKSNREDKKVFVRVYDVDDATPDTFASEVLDVNGNAGGDNIGSDSEHGGIFEFVAGASVFNATTGTGSNGRQEWAGCELKLGDNGEATVELKITMQPGDNFRAVVASSSEELNILHVGASASAGSIRPGSEPVNQFNGATSEMLTVWRKLHLEIDSMAAIPSPKPNPDYFSVTAHSWSDDGKTLTLNYTNQDVPNNFYQNGCATVGSQKFRIVSSESPTVVDGGAGPIEFGTHTLTFEDASAKAALPIGTVFEIVDDDDNLLQELGLPQSLPYDQNHAEIVKAIRPRYVPAYIQVEDANELNLNTTTRIPFQLNASPDSALGSIFNDAKDLEDSPGFWAFTVTFGYQPDAIEDYDDNSESPLRGATPKLRYIGSSYGFSVVYIETNRDRALKDTEAFRHKLASSSVQKQAKLYYFGYIYGTVAHEIGHAPGSQSENGDHEEAGLMDEFGPMIQTCFYEETIKRFRHAKQWTK